MGVLCDGYLFLVSGQYISVRSISLCRIALSSKFYPHGYPPPSQFSKLSYLLLLFLFRRPNFVMIFFFFWSKDREMKQNYLFNCSFQQHYLLLFNIRPTQFFIYLISFFNFFLCDQVNFLFNSDRDTQVVDVELL